MSSRPDAEIRAALKAAEDETVPVLDRTEMLMDIAVGLQTRPKQVESLLGALALYERALDLCPDSEKLLQARLMARHGTALQALPEEGTESLEQARAAYREAIPVLTELGLPEEIAEAEMNLGLVIQYLAGAGHARIGDAIAAYQRALRTFDRARFPIEFAILQNNLATAFLSMPVTDESGKVREALAVQAFEEGLKTVTLIDHPAEYAMLQNNLGNALQYASSGHAVENNLRALEAYDEALRVRTRETAPVEYANTIANKANCLRNLFDNPEAPEAGNHANLERAKSYYQEAREIFVCHGELGRAELVAEPLGEIEREIAAAS